MFRSGPQFLVTAREMGVDRHGADWRPDAETYLQSAFTDAPIGIALVSIDPASEGRVLQVNRALCELSGASSAELLGTDLRAMLHPDDIDPDLAASTRLACGDHSGFRLEQRLLRGGREPVWVLVNAWLVRDASGKPIYCMRQLHDIDERKRFEGELGYLADHDPLTGLLNRRGFSLELTHQMADARRYGRGGAVLAIDLDDFKHVNDTLGHNVGDEVLRDFARTVQQRLRETDVFARLGGDEFAVLLPHASTGEAQTLSAGLLTAMRDADGVTIGEDRRVTMSVGITDFHQPGKDLTADDILIDADLAMYEAKQAGKNRVAVVSATHRAPVPSAPGQKRIRSRVTWAERVRRAVREDLFVLHCQPIVELGSDTISQWELLLRLPGDHDELIKPAQFLYTAERSGLILEIDRWVLSEAIRLIAQQRDAGHQLRLEVNISGRSVGDPELLTLIEQQLQATSVDPSSLVLEVTETAAIANIGRARSFASSLTQIGCRFALDDFGAGFGSFYYLKHIPFDYVKIDGEFVRNLPASSTDQLILDSIVKMSNGLGKRTIAEFVGDHETVELLKAHGVDYAQGYHLGRPRPVSQALL
jgi:diguanylate cyclase (GGDEF)-like protein/PAS domain S-box-containing protein